MHRLLQRQLERHFGKGFEPDAALASFVATIDAYYSEVDRERKLLQNALEINNTELNQVNEKLRTQNAERTRTLLNALSDGVYATDLKGHLTFLNKAGESVLGWSEQELLGQPVHQCIHHHYPDGTEFPVETCPLLHVVTDCEAIEGQGHFIDRQNRFVPVDYRSHPIFEDDTVIGAVVSFRDISHKVEADARMRLQQAALDSAANMVVIVRADWTIEYVNAAFLALTGYGDEEIIGRAASVLNPAVFVEQLGKRIVHQGSYNTESVCYGKDGGSFEAEIYAAPVFDAKGESTHFVIVLNDIRARRLAEASLREAYDRQKAVLAELEFQKFALDQHAIVSIADPDGRITYANQRFSQISQYPVDELLGQDHRLLNSGYHPSAFFQEMWSTINQGNIWRGEVRNRRRDGSTYWVESTIVPFMDDGGRPVRYVSIRTDISARKESEDQLRHAKEVAESASRAKSDFLANMSHEIRTPMNGIIGMTELALDTELSAEQREYMSLVKTSADALLGIVNDILDFSKIEAGRMALEPIDFCLQDMLSQTTRSLAMRAHEKGLELLLAVAPEVPSHVVGDPGRLRQIIVNLVGNAIKFTRQGEVVVRVDLEPQDVSEGRLALHISVSDTGIGIAPDKFQAIFESFSQADTSTTRKYGGTGLGLSISARLVALMGGRIWLESEVGKGSTFHVVIQLLGSSEPARPQVELGRLEGMRVLIVDDNATNRGLATEILKRWKMAPVSVASGRQAIDALASAQASGKDFQLILMDNQMPDMKGFDVVSAIRGSANPTNAHIMMLTSDGQRGDASRCRDLGVAAFLLKPYSQSDLFDAIMTTLGLSHLEQAPLVTRHSVRESRRSLHILLAEDNAINQTLAQRLLDKFGHTVDVANNGVEAVRMYQAGKYDLILMDVDMPELNGYGATRQIRALERQAGGRPTPIVGLTAHVMQGSREACLAAGMDGYLSKPIDTEALWVELESLKPPDASPKVAPAAPRQAPVDRRFSLTEVLAYMDNDMDLFRSMVGVFLAEYPHYMERLRVAIDTRQMDAVHQLGHSIKGMVSVFAVPAVAQWAQSLEQGSGDMQENFSQLDKAIGWLAAELERAATC